MTRAEKIAAEINDKKPNFIRWLITHRNPLVKDIVDAEKANWLEISKSDYVFSVGEQADGAWIEIEVKPQWIVVNVVGFTPSQHGDADTILLGVAQVKGKDTDEMFAKLAQLLENSRTHLKKIIDGMRMVIGAVLEIE
jgi:hypothetical protein